MNKRGTGVMFCLISAILYSTRFISAAIFGSGVSSWGSYLYNAMLGYIGDSLTVFSKISLVIGIFYILWEDAPRIIKGLTRILSKQG